MRIALQNYRFQKQLTIIAIALFGLKIWAWYLTNSVAILTDALESTVNVTAGLIGLYSLYLSAKPRDTDHPYGHGKVEFLSAAVEGTLMIISAFLIIFECLQNIRNPHPIAKLDYGILLVAFTATINFGAGFLARRLGKKNGSIALVATGKHLQSDTYSTLGIIIGLALIYLTGYLWIDATVSLIFSFLIIFSGYKVLRTSIAGIMDEADKELLVELVNKLNEGRTFNWVDLHNLRVIKYGNVLHVDCHLTVPWFLNVNQAHDEVEALDNLVKKHFGDAVEMFVHTDGCLDFSCKVCQKPECHQRKHSFQKQISWTVENVAKNEKHQVT
jgi:cation diffusion facilitator family transporter